MPNDSGLDGGAPSRSGPVGTALQLDAAIESVTVPRPAAAVHRDGDTPTPSFGTLAEVVLPIGARSPGAARLVITHCLRGLVSQQTLKDAELLVSELVTNSVRHAELSDGDTLLVRVHLAADTLRLEIENPGTAGAVAARQPDRESGDGGFGLNLVALLAPRWGVSRSRSTTVWLETNRA
jgi:anti-sigma regulatory factor (Ser/Thr protein kinase)